MQVRERNLNAVLAAEPAGQIVQTVGNGNKGAPKNPDVAADYVMKARGAIPSERLNIVENALGLP